MAQTKESVTEVYHVEKICGTTDTRLHCADRAAASVRATDHAPAAARLLWTRSLAHVAGRLAFLVDVSDDDAVLHSCLRRHLSRRLQTEWSGPAHDESTLGRSKLFGAANLERTLGARRD